LAELLINLQQKAELVQVHSQINICRYDKDNFLLLLAVDGAATQILTGDKDLLVLRPFGKVRVQTIADYFSEIG
jgi:putative PIN family toxin of toxin-antitoxin system